MSAAAAGVGAMPATASPTRQPTRMVRQWLLVAGGLAAILVFLLGWGGLAWLVSDPSGICQVIGLLFLVGVFLSWRTARHLQDEWEAMERAAPTLHRVRNISTIVAARGDSLFGRHIGHLLHVFFLDQQVDQNRLLDHLEGRLLERLRPVALLSQLLVTLGLIGTVLGLIALVGGLGGVVGDNGAEALVRGIQTVLAGMGTAFYTTLLGAVFGGVALRILNAVIESGIERFIADLGECMEVRVLPPLRQVARRLERQRVASPPDAEPLAALMRQLEEALATTRPRT